MLKRYERPLKIVCLGLAALLVWQMANAVFTADPLKNLKVPELPTLSSATNSADKNGSKGANGTNVMVASKDSTNKTATNIAKATGVTAGTNTTNALAVSTTNLAATNLAATNLAATNLASTKAARKLPSGMTPEMLAGMPPEAMAQMMGGGGNPMNGSGGAGRPGRPKKMELPKEMKARLSAIIDSEVLGQVMHPMPMMLQGIVEDEAFIQATNGQSGPVKIGAEMAGVKLLRIGVNRVLVDDHGEKKELMIFGGAGGESLMPIEPPAAAPSTNSTATNSISTAKTKSRATNDTLSIKNKETP